MGPSTPDDRVSVLALVAHKADPEEPVVVVPLLRDFVPERAAVRWPLLERAVDEPVAVGGIVCGWRRLRYVREGVQRAVEPQDSEPLEVDALFRKAPEDALSKALRVGFWAVFGRCEVSERREETQYSISRFSLGWASRP